MSRIILSSIALVFAGCGFLDQYDGQCGSPGSGGPYPPGSRGTLRLTVAVNDLDNPEAQAAFPTDSTLELPCISWIEETARRSVRASTVPAGSSSENGNRTPDTVLEIVFEGSAESYRVATRMPSNGAGFAAPEAKFREDGAFGPAMSTLKAIEVAPELSILKITSGSSVSFSRLEFRPEGDTSDQKLVLVDGGYL